MIDRYTRPEMGHIFSLENKYRIWQEIEVLACEAHAEMGKIGITREEAAWIREHADFNKEEVDAIEAVTNHDVIAFLTNIDRDVPEGEPKPSRWVHFGMTSSDLGDTALCYQLVQATDIILDDVKKLGEICLRRAFEQRDTLCVGRTHGIHAEPMTFGMKFGSWAWELKRDYDRLKEARFNIAYGAISGAVGTYSSIDPFIEEYVCEHLGLVHDPLSTQVISRDHHAYLAGVLAGVLATTAATCDRIATEIRNLQKTDTLEAEEPFRKGQKGSSAMPHKRNPITLEKVCGLSRIVKANAQVAFDNVALWHERDISHSSAERVAQADSFIALDHMLHCLIRIVDGLILYPAQMLANLNKTRGLIYSSKVLLALVETGITREEAYAIVQENAMATWREVQQCEAGTTFREKLEADPRCTVPAEQLDEIFDPRAFLTRVDVVFDRLEQLEF